MPIHLRQNQYRGINAHLNSALQNTSGDWEMFHAAHITHLAEAIDAQLPSGYEVTLEKSLQIVEYHPDTGEKVRRRPKPDITIYDTNPRTSRSGIGSNGTAMPTLTLPAIETMEQDSELYLRAVVIYEIDANEERQAATRLELLSPTNKPSADGFLQYREKRNITLEEGTPLVEIDYLHETPPPLRRVPSYPDRQPGAHPYYIAITDTRVSLEEGQTQIYGFDVDQLFPLIDIPLGGDEILTFNLTPVYNRTFEGLSYFRNRVDYEQEPVRFESYSEADQQRIKARMAAVIEAYQRGDAE